MNLDKLHKTSKAGKHLTRVLTAWPKLRTESSFTNHGTADGNLENLQTAQRVEMFCLPKIAVFVKDCNACLTRTAMSGKTSLMDTE